MRVGTVCYAIFRGLGMLAKAFHDNGIVTDVAIVDHSSITTHPEWYPGAIRLGASRRLLTDALRQMVQAVDAMLYFETPFDWDIMRYAQSVGTKNVLMPMYECAPEVMPVEPDLYLCPSLLDQLYFPERSVFLPIPSDRRITWRQRETAEHFLHSGGYLGMQWREGTDLLIHAMERVQSPIRLTIRSQCPLGSDDLMRRIDADPRMEYHCGDVPFEEVFATGDVAVGAQKWNGCSLPLQEAFASGLLVMNTNRYPMNTWLPSEPLIPVSGYEVGRAMRGHKILEKAIVSPADIARTIDAWYGRDITAFSQAGREWGERHSWDVLGPQYLEAIGNA